MNAQNFLQAKGIKDTLYDVNTSLPNQWIKGGLSKLLNEFISLSPLSKLLAYSDRYEITIQFWPKMTVIYIAKEGVDLWDYGGEREETIQRALNYLNKINQK